MFGFSKIRLAIAGALVLAISLTIFFGYRYVTNLQLENAELHAANATLEANVETLKGAVASQQQAIESLQQDYNLIIDIQQDTFIDFQDARNRVTSLERRLERHELGFLASRRPGLVENIINDATRDILRCFEIATGSPLTPEEVSAILPSEVNSECPDLANPNRRDR